MSSKGDIVIVDDNLNNLTLLAGILREVGYQVRVAKSGRQAIELVTFQLPELMMLDIEMPDMDGFEVCRRLKADKALRSFPVIFISALDDTRDKVKGFEVGGVDYVTKPFHSKEVLARVATQLELYRLRRDLEIRNVELAKRNEELIEAHQRTDRVFSALSEALPGTVLDEKYRLDIKIGSGGFGAVFRAMHLDLDRPVAVKVFRPIPGNDSPEGLERFRREGIAASRLTHPNAVEIHDFGISSNGIAYIVMELLRGFTLSATLSDKKRLPLARCAEIVVPICEVLSDAHTAGIVHRDIKPSNVFLHQTKRGEVVKVVDFGIAKIILNDNKEVTNITEAGSVVGTSDYMSPEQLTGEECSGQSDVYSVGIMLYQMLVGQMPFKSGGQFGSLGTTIKRLIEEPISIGSVDSSIPANVQTLIEKTLAREPDKRPTARQLAVELAALSTKT